MIGVLGYDSALLRLYWAGDSGLHTKYLLSDQRKQAQLNISCKHKGVGGTHNTHLFLMRPYNTILAQITQTMKMKNENENRLIVFMNKTYMLIRNADIAIEYNSVTYVQYKF